MRADCTSIATVSTSTLARIVLLSSALALTGCPRTVNAPATELPGLAPINTVRSDEWPIIRTQDGDSQQLTGPIEGITLTHSSGVDPLGADFNAGIVGDNLSIIDGRGPRVYSLATKPYLTINYTDRKAGFIIGGSALIAGGLAVGVLGAVTLVEGADLLDSGGFGAIAGVFVSIFGLAVAGTGVGLTVGGIVLATRTPEKPKAMQSATVVPKLHFGPGGAGFSVKF